MAHLRVYQITLNGTLLKSQSLQNQPSLHIFELLSDQDLNQWKVSMTYTPQDIEADLVFSLTRVAENALLQARA